MLLCEDSVDNRLLENQENIFLRLGVRSGMFFLPQKCVHTHRFLSHLASVQTLETKGVCVMSALTLSWFYI